MKRTIILFLMLISISAFAQSPTVDKLTARQKITSPLYFKTNGDTLLSKLDTATNVINGSFSKYNYTKLLNIKSSPWEKSGSNIYYNAGNVFIGQTSGTYTLDVNGLIGGTNLETNTTSKSTRLGFEAGYSENETAARYNTMIGYRSGRTTSTGSSNVFVGYSSGYSNTTGTRNNFIGYSAGQSNSTGNDNVAIGYNAGASLTSGYKNVLIGNYSGNLLTTGMLNTIVGHSSCSNVTGNYNTAVGAEISITSGISNTIIGHYAGRITTTGSYNSFFGNESAYSNSTGQYNSYFGFLSGANSNGSNNVFLGAYSGRYETNSNTFAVDNQDRSNLNSQRVKSLIYGKFDADTLNQSVDINGRLRYTGTFAEIYRHKDSTAYTQSIPTGTTPTKILAFSTNGFSTHCTSDAANDKITITKQGYYQLTLTMSYYSGTNNVTWTAYIYQDGTALSHINSTENTSTVSQYRPTSLGGLIHVSSVPCDIDYRVTHDNGESVDITYKYINMHLTYIGE